MSQHTTHNKLVRDRIPEIIAAEAEPGELVRELADLYEVIDALLVAFDLDKNAIRAVQQKRRDERGGFEQRIKLRWADVAS